ncbi:MAG TPA: DUF6599 family protein [Candidatus Sulfotelmatobacter sp.]|nr:DUF6599 family protein [Candidatus Sulfotelmatobacter sp.]
MSFSRFFLVLTAVISVAGAGYAANPAPGPVEAQAAPLLPQQFGGWQRQGSAQISADAVVGDPANADVLKEYGFTDFAACTYVRDDGRTLKIRAARFGDASGAFGAYSFYLQPEMVREQIGDQGASLGQRVLFYRNHILVDALFTKESPMAGAELRELAGMLPRPAGNAGNLPPVLAFMPHRGYVANTEKYVIGPVALGALSPPVSEDLVDFGAKPEVTIGKYLTPSGQATLMLIYYPTPQLATEHLRRIDAAHQLAQPQAGVSSVENMGQFFDKRTGFIVAVASGPVSESDARFLLGLVNYEANVTWNERTDNRDVHDLYSLILNVVILCGILGALAIVAGVAFGGFRILMKRFYPDKIFDRPEQMEFISLHLDGAVAEEHGHHHSGGVRHRKRSS